MRGNLFILFACLWCAPAFASDGDSRWEIGAGLGHVRYVHYPASDQQSDLTLPFPTFQYRGKVLRADDREGARVYLLKRPGWALELSGTGYPALDSSKNTARREMDDLPWLLALGPQGARRISERWTLKIGVFQAVSSDFRSAALRGAIWEVKANYKWLKALSADGPFGWNETSGTFALEMKSAGQELMSLYFSVPAAQATAERPQFDARAGFLSAQASYFQSIKSGPFSLYVGGRWTDYGFSVNRRSPLHKTDQNISYLVGATYVLYESEASAVSEQATSGVIDVIRTEIKEREK